MPEGGVRSHADDTRTLITIDRPPVNAMDAATVEALRAAFSGAPKHLPVILTGGGSVFCAGVDTRAFAQCSGAEKAEMVLNITRMTAAILAHPAPVIAAVNGHAMGGGFVLMLACDVRIVSDAPTSRFGLTEARAGIPFPSGPLEIMRHEVEPALLRRLTLTSDIISAGDLFDAHIADRTCSADALLSEAHLVAAETASQPAFAMVKRQMRGALSDRVSDLAQRGDDPLAASLRAGA